MEEHIYGLQQELVEKENMIEQLEEELAAAHQQIDSLTQALRYTQAFFYSCPQCPSCLASATQMGQATWAIWTAIKKYSMWSWNFYVMQDLFYKWV